MATAVSATHHHVTGLKKPAAETTQAYWKRVSASYSPMMFPYGSPEADIPTDYTPRTYDLCEYCWHFARVRMFVTSPDTPKPMCVCCAVRFAYPKAPVAEPDDEDRPVPNTATPEVAMALLNASSFARRRIVRSKHVDEVDLENPDNGRIFGSQYVDLRTGEEVELDEDGMFRAQCRDCIAMRSVGGHRCRPCYTEWNLELDLAVHPEPEPEEDLP